jgi:hypothetical protein
MTDVHTSERNSGVSICSISTVVLNVVLLKESKLST